MTLVWYKHLYILLMWMLSSLNKKNLILAAIVSRCHHEGDFTVSCNDNKSKLPLLPSSSGSAFNHDDHTLEYMRYAKVISGLYHNDTLCSYVPNTTCFRKQTLHECEDKEMCKVKNGWLSLEPHCNGNSYYTQLEYDCQPAFFMCDKETVINNVFSGMIYSPSYPNSFRKEDKSEPCYLTIHLPKNHHAEITLDHFDMLKTAKCIGDYVEIQQYKEIVSPSMSASKSSSSLNDLNENDYLKIFSRRDITGESSSHISVYNNRSILKVKKSRQQRKPKYKWQTLGTMCGRIDKAYTLRATADTINFKFRPLSANHPYLQTLNSQNKLSKSQTHAGFKIFFQAIPPKSPLYESAVEDGINDNSVRTTTLYNSMSSNFDETEYALVGNESSSASRGAKDHKLKIPLWLILTLVSIGVLVLAAVMVGIVFFVFKRKNSKSGTKSPTAASSSSKSSSRPFPPIPSSSSSSQTLGPVTPKKPASITAPITAAPSALSKPELKPKKSSFGTNLEFESHDDPLKNSSSSVFAGGVSGAGTSTPQKKKVVLVEEPRKMQAERPALLLDLSQSKLLLKYKLENNSNNPTSDAAIASNSPATAPDPAKNEVSAKSNASPTKSTHSSPKKTPPSKTNSINSMPKKLNLSFTENSGGVYGAEVDNGGVYGADPQAITSRPSSITKPLTKTNSNESKRKESILNNEENVDCKSEKEKLIRSPNDENTNGISNQKNYRNILKSSKKNSILIDENDSSLLPLLINSDLTLPDSSQNPNNTITSNISEQNQTTAPLAATPATTSRKQAFNPLYVILKDKNKYHTTEYI